MILKNRWFYRGLGFLAISLLIWFIGPLIAFGGHYFLDSIVERLIAIGLIVMLVVIYIIVKRQRLKAKSKRFAEKLKLEGERKEEADAVSSRFDEAMSTLKAATSSKGEMLIQQLPWYILIGPPGSGKTTILNNSGLEFPLADDLGVNTVQGIGGTRHCDWWFTNEAVLIDTAGRFTTQDSNTEIDKAAWRSFLHVLKKNRKTQPINGVLITVSISELYSKSENEKKLYSKTIRRRIDELSEELGFRFPVYFIFTKCDLIKGFNAYFSSITPQEREQVFGHTFALETKNGQQQAFDIEQYETYFDELIDRLNDKLSLQLSLQKDKTKKAELLAFPAQLANYKKLIQSFLNDIFSENKFQRPAMLRGVYYTSGTQQGSPLDSLLGSVAAEMGVDASQELHFSGVGKSYFIKDLLTEVIFPEQNISTFDYRKERLHKRLQFISLAAALILCLSTSALLFRAYQINQTKLATSAKIADKQQALVNARENQIPSFRQVIAELNTAYSGMTVFENETFLDNLGLSQKSSIDNQAYATYLSTLESRLLPLVKIRLEKNILASLDAGETGDTNTFLKAYLMYAGKSVSESQSEKDWLQTLTVENWQQGLRLSPKVRKSLDFHFSHLLKNSFTQIQLNEKVVEQARATLKKRPIEELVYADLKLKLQSENVNNLTFRELSGEDGKLLFQTNRGDDISELFIPRLFTNQGFDEFSEKLTDSLAKKLEDSWILGNKDEAFSNDEIGNIEAQIFSLYETDYIKVWQNFIKSLKVRQPSSISAGTEVLSTLQGHAGPFQTLISNIAKETTIEVDESVKNALSAVTAATKNKSERVRRIVKRATQYSQSQGDEDVYPGYYINRRFNQFHELISVANGQNELANINENLARFAEMILSTITDTFSETAALDMTFDRMKGGRESEFNSLTSSSRSYPPEVKTWLTDVSDLGWTLILLQARTEIQTQWENQVWSLYEQTLNDRYPLVKDSQQEAELADFVSFFSPEGVLQSFAQEYIFPFVDRRKSGWQLRPLGGKTIQFDPASLNRLKQLTNLTETFFKGGQDTPSLTLTFTPITLDANATQFSFMAGAQAVEYSHGPRRSSKLDWPLPPSNEVSKVSFNIIGGEKYEQVEQGPWSLFQLFDRAKIAPSPNGSVYQVTFTLENYSAVYEVRADSEINPLSLIYMRHAKLPENL